MYTSLALVSEVKWQQNPLSHDVKASKVGYEILLIYDGCMVSCYGETRLDIILWKMMPWISAYSCSTATTATLNQKVSAKLIKKKHMWSIIWTTTPNWSISRMWVMWLFGEWGSQWLYKSISQSWLLIKEVRLNERKQKVLINNSFYQRRGFFNCLSQMDHFTD